MNNKKLNQILLKYLRSGELLRFNETDSEIWLTNKYIAWKVRKIDLDINWLKVKSTDKDLVKDIPPKAVHRIEDTGIRKLERYRDKITAIFKAEKFNVYIDVKSLEAFDTSDLRACENNLSPIAVYERGELVGLIMPVKPIEENILEGII
jgi:hypothetical protein